MPNNRLFLYISESHAAGFRIKQNAQGCKFALRDLAIGKDKIEDDNNMKFKLHSHHISVYAYQSDNPHCSEYHYTAFLEGENHNQYQLHVYFNKDGSLATDPELSLLTKNGPVREQISKNLSDTFRQFAIQHSQDDMDDLHIKLKNQIADLRSQYAVIKKKLEELSSNMVLNRDKYVAKLDVAIDILKNLSMLTGNEDDNSSLNIHRLIKESMAKQMKAASPVVKKPIVVAPVVEEKSPAPLVKAAPTMFKKPNIKKDKKRNSLSIPLGDVEAILKRINEESNCLTKLDLFLSYSASICELMLFVDDDTACTAEELAKANKLYSKRGALGSSILYDLLSRGELNKANYLREFINPVPKSIIDNALRLDNGKLLDFLLTYGKISVDQYLVNNKDTLVQYCLHHHTQAAPKLECFSVLIKHGASLFDKKEANGFSIAHTIIATPGCELALAFVEHENLLVKNSFYKKIIKEIKDLLAGSKFTDEERKLLEERIKSLEIKDSFSLVSQSQQDSFLLNKTAELSKELMRSNNHADLAKLSLDPEIKLALSRFRNFASCYVKNIDLRKSCKNSNEEMGKMLVYFNKFPLTKVPYDELRSIFITYLNNNTTLLDMKNQVESATFSATPQNIFAKASLSLESLSSQTPQDQMIAQLVYRYMALYYIDSFASLAEADVPSSQPSPQQYAAKL